jgi:hypothetical protein
MILGDAVKSVPPAASFSDAQRAKGAETLRRQREDRAARGLALVEELKHGGWTALGAATVLGLQYGTVRKWWRGECGPSEMALAGLKALVLKQRVEATDAETAAHLRKGPGLRAGATRITAPPPPAEGEDPALVAMAARYQRNFDAAIGTRDLAIAIVMEFHERLCRLEAHAARVNQGTGEWEKLPPLGAGLKALDALVREAFP